MGGCGCTYIACIGLMNVWVGVGVHVCAGRGFHAKKAFPWQMQNFRHGSIKKGVHAQILGVHWRMTHDTC